MHKGIGGYPTLMRLGSEADVQEYSGERSLEAIVDFALEPFRLPHVIESPGEGCC